LINDLWRFMLPLLSHGDLAANYWPEAISSMVGTRRAPAAATQGMRLSLERARLSGARHVPQNQQWLSPKQLAAMAAPAKDAQGLACGIDAASFFPFFPFIPFIPRRFLVGQV